MIGGVPIWVLRDLVTSAPFAWDHRRTEEQHGAAPLLVVVGVIAPKAAGEGTGGTAEGAADGDEPAVSNEEAHCGGVVVVEVVRVVLVYEISD